jgi:hypothetical protein
MLQLAPILGQAKACPTPPNRTDTTPIRGLKNVFDNRMSYHAAIIKSGINQMTQLAQFSASKIFSLDPREKEEVEAEALRIWSEIGPGITINVNTLITQPKREAINAPIPALHRHKVVVSGGVPQEKMADIARIANGDHWTFYWDDGIHKAT